MGRFRVAVLSASILALVATLAGCNLPFLPGSGDGGGGGTARPIFNVAPVPIISADVVRGIVPLTVRFSSTASTDDGIIVDRQWNFGDGQTSREISPAHTFETTGTFTVTLTLTDDRGARSSRNVVISVTQAPIARIVVDRTAAESAPATFNFDGSTSSDPDGSISSHQWDFGDGSRESLAVVTHTFARPGTYRARLTVTDNTGVSNTASISIEVGIPKPTITFRTPPDHISNVVVSRAAPLWAYVVFEIEPGTPRTLRAGLDGDRDPCDAVTAILDASNGSALLDLSGHTDRVRSAAFSPDGQFVVSGSDDRTLRLYSTADGLLLNSYGGIVGAVSSVAFSPDSARLAFGGEDGTAAVRDRQTGGQIREFAGGHTGAINAVAYAPDGNAILTGGEDTKAIIWSISTGATLRTITGHAQPINAVAFAPNDPTLIATGSSDQSARVWDAANGAQLLVLVGHTAAVTSLAFSPDGTLLVTGSEDRTARIWDTGSGQLLRTFSGHNAAVAAVAFSPDGLRVITGSADATAKIWDRATGELRSSLQPCQSTVNAVAFSPDGGEVLAAVGARNSIQLDTSPAQGNDLNLTVPTALLLNAVPPGEYFLWAEIDTDRTAPQRTYANPVINVVEAYTASIDEFTPKIPLVNDKASVVVAPTNARQIFDLGALKAGDQIVLSLLDVPGFRRTYAQDLFSVMILNAQQRVFSWFQSGFVRFTPQTRLVVAEDSANYFVVIDSGSSVDVEIKRQAGVIKRVQRVFLDFRGANNISIGGLSPFTLPEFDANDFNSTFGDSETQAMKNKVAQVTRDYFDPWNIEITTSDEGDPPAPPYMTVYFGGFSFFLFGIADYIDPRNDTLTGSALVTTLTIAEVYFGESADQLAERMGVVTAHEIGHLLGLRHVDNTSDVMGFGDPSLARVFTNSPLAGSEQLNSAIGEQDVPKQFEEIFGLKP